MCRPIILDVAYNFDDESDLVITETGTVTHTGVTGFVGGANFPVDISGVSGNGTLTVAVSTTSDVENGLGEGLDSSVTSEVIVIQNPEVPATSPFGLILLAGVLGLTIQRLRGR